MSTCLSRKITLFLLLAGLLQAACRKEEAGPAEVSPEQEQKRQSVFLTREDSLRWVGYLRANPEDTARAFVMLGVLYRANDHPEVTVRYLELADDYDPGRPVIYLNLGDAYNRIGMKLGEAGKKDSMEIMCAKAAEAFKWYVQRVPRSAVTEEIYRIVEKYKSMQSEKEIPR